MKLATYLQQHQLTDQAFAELIGRERSVVSRYRTGAVCPSLETIAAIDRVTGGTVSFQDFTATQERVA
jgi:DNA-binding transcriptional regulator YdaS (Cro superfamily)